MTYTKIRNSLLYVFACCLISLNAQNVTVRGVAHDWYRGRVIELSQMSDFVTMNRVTEAGDTVKADGSFELKLHVNATMPVYLKVENYTAQLYVQPDYVYAITLPEPEHAMNVNNDVELPLNIGIIGGDSTELNALIFDFQRQYNKLFIPEDDRYLGRAALFRRADSLQKVCDYRYRHVDNPYFDTYVTYFIASVNSAVSRGKLYLLHKYILSKPIQHRHYEYMGFFGSFFKGYFQSVASRYPGQSLYNIINDKADYARLSTFLQQDKLLASDSLRELVCLFNLWDCYYSAEFNSDAVESLVSQLLTDTRVEEHKKIARNMLAYFGKLQVGSEAPDFSARTRDGKVGTLSMFKGRWIYLNFFSSSNSSSLREMMKIADLQRRYGHKLVFLSICLDDSLTSYAKFLNENPRYGWQIWYNYDPSFTITAKETFDVTGTEAYFLISNLGEIVQNPAVSPSEGIEYKFNVIFKVRQRTHRTGIR